MMSMYLDSAAPYLSDAFAREDFDFNGRQLAGLTEMKPRWKRCVETTDALLGEALGQKYVERKFPPQSKKRARAMVDNLLWAMGDTIKGLAWMGPETKAKALEKLSTFNPKIGYPDTWKAYTGVEVKRWPTWMPPPWLMPESTTRLPDTVLSWPP